MYMNTSTHRLQVHRVCVRVSRWRTRRTHICIYWFPSGRGGHRAPPMPTHVQNARALYLTLLFQSIKFRTNSARPQRRSTRIIEHHRRERVIMAWATAQALGTTKWTGVAVCYFYTHLHNYVCECNMRTRADDPPPRVSFGELEIRSSELVRTTPAHCRRIYMYI